MKLTSTCFADGGAIPGECAFAVPDRETRIALSSNRNPDLQWSGLPVGTRSLALICHDPDVPTVLDDFNQEGRVIAADIPRMSLYHWALVDVRPDGGGIAKGQYAHGVVARGKPGPETSSGARQGLNGYTDWFRDDPNMAGNYFGYDGPCPPWNDALVHRYVFTLYALDVERCPVSGAFTAADVLKAIDGHVLAKATLTGRYTLSPDVAIGACG
ncbi:MAG TPA: YbhB/YbcL family Raf kinase inhibitor-like protein [Azoarcus taiwanensis]|nr:YbhB/YbcL family Raf kinase inhibitor-like protein [Azoarcus taiwanensis]